MGSLFRQYSHDETRRAREFLDKKDYSNFDKEICLAVFPNQTHLLSMLIENESGFVELCEWLLTKCKERNTDEDELFLQRLIHLIQLPTRTKQSDQDANNEENNNDKLTYIQKVFI